jgi:hypothetical protein
MDSRAYRMVHRGEFGRRGCNSGLGCSRTRTAAKLGSPGGAELGAEESKRRASDAPRDSMARLFTRGLRENWGAEEESEGRGHVKGSRPVGPLNRI